MRKELDKYVERVLISQEDLEKRIRELGDQITKDYAYQQEDLVLVCILKGSVVFMAELMKYIDLDCSIDFMSVSSYGSSTRSSGDVRIYKDLDNEVMGKNVLIVEDIIDSGYTLAYLKKNFEHRGANSVKVASLLNKPSRRIADVEGDYVGFEIPDAFVVGYGLDYNQKLRNLSYIGVLKKEYQ